MYFYIFTIQLTVTFRSFDIVRNGVNCIIGDPYLEKKMFNFKLKMYSKIPCEQGTA